MSGGHSHLLYRHGDSLIHHLPAHAKLLALVGFMLVVVATPRDRYLAFAGYAVLLAVVAVVAGVPFRFIATRMVVEVPFVVFAVLLPVISTGPRIDVLGLSLSEDGLLAGWNILAKGTLGVVAAILLAAFQIYNLQPGPLLFANSPDLVWALIASLYIGNVMLLVLNLPLVGLFARMLAVPIWILMPDAAGRGTESRTATWSRPRPAGTGARPRSVIDRPFPSITAQMICSQRRARFCGLRYDRSSLRARLTANLKSLA